MDMDIYLHGASCRITSYCTLTETVILECLYTHRNHRGKGASKKLLRAVKKWAQRKRVAILLYIGAFADRPMDDDQLFRFYSKMGFVPFHPEHDTRTRYMCFNFSSR